MMYFINLGECMDIISDKKLSLIAKLIVAYVLLLDFAFLIFALTAEPTTDVASVTASLLGWSATLYTPMAAYILYDSWKNQKQYDFEKEILDTILQNLSESYYEIIPLNVRINHIKNRFYGNISLIPNLYEFSPDYNPRKMQTIYAQLDKINIIKSDIGLLEIFRDYENTYLALKNLNNKLILISENIEEKTSIEKENITELFNVIYDEKKTYIYHGDRTNAKRIEVNLNYRDADIILRDKYNDLTKIILSEIKKSIY